MTSGGGGGLNVAEFLTRLRKEGIELRAGEGDKLVVNAPKGAVTEAIGDEIRRNKQEVLAFLRAGAADGGGGAGGGAQANIPKAELTPAPDGSGALHAPLSFGQNGLFYIDQFEPGQSIFNVPIAFWLKGVVEDEHLRGAINDMIERHSVFRTTLRLTPGGAVQYIAPSLSIDLATVDLQSESDKDARLQETLTEHARVPFDLGKGPLIRAVLIRLEKEKNVLLLTMHHVITDGWSQDVMEREIVAHYDARKKGVPTSLPPPALQYSDFVVWTLNAAKDDPERKKRVAYWNERLKQPLPVLELPTTYPRTAGSTAEGETAAIELPSKILGELTAVGRKEGATLFMVLLAAYATLLHRVTGQDEIVIGSPIANRGHAQTQEIIGYITNTVALRIDLSNAPTFRELLKRVREVAVGAYTNQDIFFEEIVETLGTVRDRSRTPVFQTMFAFEDTLPGGGVGAGDGAPKYDLTVTHRDTVHAKVARSDLAAWVARTPEDNLAITFEYPIALFDKNAMMRLLDQYQVLLRAIADGSDAPINRLPILSKEERKLIVEDWNATARALPEGIVGAYQLFEREVDAHPDKTAVVYHDTKLTYRELDQRANRLAQHFVESGVAFGALLGLFLERSHEMVVVLLAIQKVGGTYVPIDPEYPRDRVALMIKDSGLTHIITTKEMSERLPLENLEKKPALIQIDDEAEAKTIAARSSERLPCKLKDGEHPCYVIYTSGSTGVPKGVMVPHRALINLLMSMAREPGMSADDVLVAITTLSFDISGLEMYLPLVVGGTMVVADADDQTDDQRLRDLVEKSGCTVLQGTPAMWRRLIGSGWEGVSKGHNHNGNTGDKGGDGRKGRFKALCGGEAFPPDLIAPLLDRVTSLWNVYGPTETTIWSTCTEIKRTESGDLPRTITIGKPIDNTYIYILDSLGEPTPIGVPGELVIGGVGVSLGYLNREELTASKFVPDVFHGDGKKWMYKTGDVATWRSDGEIVFTGRIDHQVKVRGYRIECGEIEAVLCEHDLVERAVVIVREDRVGDARLVAYLIFKDGQSVTPTDIRKHLRKKLPDYMIPQHVMELQSFPLTPAGKVNRKALPAPTDGAKQSDARQPESPSELLLAKIWKEVLSAQSVTALDNFFDLGGHSLLSVVAVARIQAETGVRISPRDLLLSSLEQIALLLSPATQSKEEKRAAPPPKDPPKAAGGMLSRLKGKIFG